MEDIERYVLDHMPPVKREEFEQLIAGDAQLQKEVELYHKLVQGESPPASEIRKEIRNKLKNHEALLPPLTEEDLLNSDPEE